MIRDYQRSPGRWYSFLRFSWFLFIPSFQFELLKISILQLQNEKKKKKRPRYSRDTVQYPLLCRSAKMQEDGNGRTKKCERKMTEDEREKRQEENQVLSRTLRVRDSCKFSPKIFPIKGVRDIVLYPPVVVRASFSHWSPRIRDVTTPAYVKVKHEERQYIVVRHVDRVSTLNHPLPNREP